MSVVNKLTQKAKTIYFHCFDKGTRSNFKTIYNVISDGACCTYYLGCRVYENSQYRWIIKYGLKIIIWVFI